MAGITFFDRALEPQFAQLLLDEARSALREGKPIWRTNFGWAEGVRRASHPVLVRDYGSPLADLIRSQLAATGVIDLAHSWRVMGYCWTSLSYIPWHNDRDHAEAVTVYLNDRWEADWGGLFLWRDQQEGAIRAYEPRCNTALRNSGAVLHATTPVMLDAPEPRFTLQLFR
jgi:hypothetical protein